MYLFFRISNQEEYNISTSDKENQNFVWELSIILLLKGIELIFENTQSEGKVKLHNQYSHTQRSSTSFGNSTLTKGRSWIFLASQNIPRCHKPSSYGIEEERSEWGPSSKSLNIGPSVSQRFLNRWMVHRHIFFWNFLKVEII